MYIHTGDLLATLTGITIDAKPIRQINYYSASSGCYYGNYERIKFAHAQKLLFRERHSIGMLEW